MSLLYIIVISENQSCALLYNNIIVSIEVNLSFSG